MSAAVSNFPIIAIITFFLGAFLIALIGRLNKVLRNVLVFISVTVPLVLMCLLIKPVMTDGQIVAYWMGNWAPVSDWAIGIGIEVDALGLFFGLIVTLAAFVSALYSFTYMNRDDSLENYYTLFLMLSGALLGLTQSGDLFNIFVMIEIMTMTIVALTAFRVDYDGALEGGLKYMVVGSIGSTCLLVGIAMTYRQLHTLNLAQIASKLPGNMNAVTIAAFAFLLVGFITKASLFPFHPIEADAQTVAPASISLMISGVITKCGVYGLIRVCYNLFQNIDAPSVEILITGFGALSCFICVTMAFNQHNFKRLLAFHSISQVGYVIAAAGLGTALGLNAGLYHAMNHLLLDRLGGLSKKMPKTCALFLIGAASISGLPPFNGFASKWLIYQASFEKGVSSGNFYFVVICVICLISSVLTLASFVKVSQSVFFGQLNPQFENTKEVPAAMRIPMWILAILCILTGLFPDFVMKYLTGPAANAAIGVGNYIDSMLGQGTAAKVGIAAQVTTETGSYGLWSPISWMLLLLIITCAVCLVSVIEDPKKTTAEERFEYNKSKGRIAKLSRDGFKDAGRELPEAQSAPMAEYDKPGHHRNPVLSGSTMTFTGEKDPKYEVFFSGEMPEYSQVGGSDLFWGFKHTWRHYFRYWQKWHSGIVNDYVLYGVAALAFVLLYAVLFV